MIKIISLGYLILLLWTFIIAALTYTSSSPVVYRPLRSQPEKARFCSRNTQCLFAVCEWSQNVRKDRDRCIFIPSGCKCQRGKKCRRTEDIQPENDYLIFPFTCQ